MKNLVARRYLIFSGIVILICMACMVGFNNYQDVEYKEALNKYACAMVEMVKKNIRRLVKRRLLNLLMRKLLKVRMMCLRIMEFLGMYMF